MIYFLQDYYNRIRKVEIFLHKIFGLKNKKGAEPPAGVTL